MQVFVVLNGYAFKDRQQQLVWNDLRIESRQRDRTPQCVRELPRLTLLFPYFGCGIILVMMYVSSWITK